MGKKSKAALAAEKVLTQKVLPESNNTGLERVETEPEATNLSLEKIEVQAEIQPMAAKEISKKMPRKHIVPATVRRSQRVKSALLPRQNEDIERVIQEITVSESSESENEDDQDEQHMHQEKELKFKTTKTKSTFLYETSSYAERKYRGLYIDSRKKIEALTEENRQLALKLECALDKLEGLEASTEENRELALKLENSHGKVEAYEKVLEIVKEVLIVARATETAPNVCTEPINGALNEIRSSKRTRSNQESGKN